MPLPKGRGSLQPVAAKLAGGTQLVLVSHSDDLTEGKLQWIHDVEHPERGRTELDLKHFAVQAIDASGRVYVDEAEEYGNHKLSMVRDGKRIGEVVIFSGATALAPDPGATRFAMMGVNGLELATADGKTQWVLPTKRGTPIWLDDNHLVLDTHQGLSSIDLAAGSIAETRCGWSFGLSATPDPVTPTIASQCVQLAVGRGDDFEIPGDAAFKTAAKDIASASSGTIAEWGSAPINGAMHRFAVIVVSQGQMDMNTLVAYLVEATPGSYVEAIFHGWGFVQPNYEGLVPSPAWTVGTFATQARQDKWGNPISKYSSNAFTFETRWIHMSGETIGFTLRGSTFVVTGWNWAERENDNGKAGNQKYAHWLPPQRRLATFAIKAVDR